MKTDADLFHELHAGPRVLMLANCWDAGSARLLESLGASAIATTSAGLAWSLGYGDIDDLPIKALVPAVAAIARVIDVPLSVDMVGGYADDPAHVGENVAAVVAAGAVGINLEDGAASADHTARKIEAARSAADRAGVRLYINARTDVYLRGLVADPERVAESIARGRRYRDAGASGFFVPKVVEENAIAEIAQAVDLPLNVLAWTGLPPASRLAELGVRRLSAGSGIALSALARARDVANRFLGEGRSEALATDTMPYAEMNSLFSR